MPETYSPKPGDFGKENYRRYTDQPELKELLQIIEEEKTYTLDGDGNKVEVPSKIGTLALKVLDGMQDKMDEIQEENLDLRIITNRRAFFELAPNILERIKESGTDSVFFMIDLDHFKKVNDEFGHKAGDIVLKTFAKAMENTFREEDLYARIGGEEFTALLIGIKGSDAINAAKRLDWEYWKLINEEEELSDELKKKGCLLSIGATVINEEDFNNGTPDIEKIMSRADSNLYKVKESTRNGIIVDDNEVETLRETK
jgi:diguanylate cyclase (GGDEF)-like protein